MSTKVWVQLHNGEERTYEAVTRVDVSDRYKIMIYNQSGVLAVVDKGDLKNLLTDNA